METLRRAPEALRRGAVAVALPLLATWLVASLVTSRPGPALAAGAEAGTADAPLRLAADVWPPYTDAEGAPRLAIDLVGEALERAGVEATTRIREDFAAVLGALREGELDGSPALWRSEEREAFLVFSEPYLENRLVLLGRRGSDAARADLGDLTGRRVALVHGYEYGELESTPGPEFVYGESERENLQRLLRGEVDVVLVDELVVHALFERQGERARALLERGTRPIVRDTLHLALRRDLPGARSILRRFDAAVREMLADGSYNRILGVTWLRADVDGDGEREMVLGGEQAAGPAAPRAGYEVFAPASPEAVTDPDEAPGFIIEGRAYDTWSQVPPEYQAPDDRTTSRPQPRIPLFEF